MDEKKWCVYRHTNNVNGKVYIGITGDVPERRWARGLRYSQNEHFTAAIKKYGWDGFEHEVLETGLTQEEASKKEIELIASYRACDRRYGYNKALGGVGRLSVSDTTREKMRESHMGEKNHNYGKPKPEETKQKLRESNLKHWAEQPRKRGYNRPEEVCQKMRVSRTGRSTAWRGGHHSEETIEKIRKANSKPVLCLETNTVYQSARVASKELGVQYSSISQVCNGIRNTAGSFHWQFAEEVGV